MRLSQGSVYPALIRLEQSGWIRTEWGISESPSRPDSFRPAAPPVFTRSACCVTRA